MALFYSVADFGAFIDIGAETTGFVHISQISQKLINHPTDILKAGDNVKVRVLDVDADKKRISLTMKSDNNSDTSKQYRKHDRKTPERNVIRNSSFRIKKK